MPNLSREEEVIKKIFVTLPPVAKPWCVEFGAGRFNNNTWPLIQKQNWHGVLIEANPAFLSDLKKVNANNSRVVCLEKRVQFKGADTLDAILQTTTIPPNFDFLVIDIDGNDFHVWQSLKFYQPRVVMIEYNGRIPLEFDFVQPADPNLSWGSSLQALVRLGKEKGYELVYAFINNAIFVKKEFFPLFHLTSNRPEDLMKKFWPATSWFQLYDGTIVLHGYEQKKMLNFKKKITREPLYLLTEKEMTPLTFRRDRKFIRWLKNLFKKTFLFKLLYLPISDFYCRRWQQKKKTL